MFIDAHTHLGLNDFCDTNTVPFKYDLVNKPDDFIKFMNENGIDKAVILPIPGNNYNSLRSNKYLQDAVTRFPDRFIPFCKFDNNLSINLTANGFYGAKFHVVYEKYKSNDLELYYKTLEYYGCPLIIHAKFTNKGEQIKKILEIAPNLKIILAHMGRGHIYTDEMVEDLLNEFKDYNNVYFETSTVGRSRVIEMACKIIGSKRLMFGSDYPFGKAWFKDAFFYKDEIEPILDARISNVDRTWIFSETINTLIADVDKRRNEFYVRPMIDKDKSILLNGLLNLSVEDKKLLALDKKIQLIKGCIRNHKHIYVGVLKDKIIGFFRESGRTNNEYMLEELVVFDDYKEHGFASKMMDFYVTFFPKSMVKTSAKNAVMIHILKKHGFLEKNIGQRIISWWRE